MDVGKHFPITPKCFVDYRQNGPSNFGLSYPRRLKFVAKAHTAIGTIAILWQGVDVVSEVADYAPESTKKLLYHFDHPTVSTTHAELRVEFFQTATGVQLIHHKIEFFDSTTVVGRKEGDFQPGYVFGHWPQPPYNWQWGPFWVPLIDPVKWSQFLCDMGAGTWDDSPDFTPYKTRD